MDDIKALHASQVLFLEAERLGYAPTWKMRDSLFSFQANGRTHFISYTRLHLNSQLGSWISTSKLATHIVLEENGVRTIPFRCPLTLEEALPFFAAHKPVVYKPMAGRQGREVILVTEQAEFEALTFSTQYLLEEYVPGPEYRYLVLQGKVLAVRRKDSDPAPDNRWRSLSTNLTQEEWDPAMAASAERIAGLLRLGFAAVDFIVNEAGEPLVLEANSMPGVRSFYQPDAGEPILVAEPLLKAIIES